jgi:hypothetical protein
MKYLKIQNDGLLDVRLVALMGGTYRYALQMGPVRNAKASDEW